MSNLPFHLQPAASTLSGIVIANGANFPTSRKVNLTAIADPTINDDSGDGYGALSFWVNTASGAVWICADASVGAAVWVQGSGTSGGVKETVVVANSFNAGDIIRRTAGTYSLAIATSASNAEVVGIVETASGTQFTMVFAGKISLPSHGYTVGDVLFLSPSTAGLMTTTEPSTVGQISKPVAIVLDADNLLVVNMRGITVGEAVTLDSLTPATAAGSLIGFDGSTSIDIPIGLAGQRLAVNSTADAVEYVDPELPASPTLGDIAYFDGASWVSRAVAAEGRWMRVVSGVPDWSAGTPKALIRSTYTGGAGIIEYSATTWTKKTNLSEVFDTGSICTLASNVITLPAGTYLVRFMHVVPYNANWAQMRLRDTTNSVTLINSGDVYNNTQNSGQGMSTAGMFTLAGSANIEWQHICKTAAGNAFTYHSGTESGGDNLSVFGEIYFEKLY